MSLDKGPDSNTYHLSSEGRGFESRLGSGFPVFPEPETALLWKTSLVKDFHSNHKANIVKYMANAGSNPAPVRLFYEE